jgi:ADP-heptose:LPS heptosyltransferase
MEKRILGRRVARAKPLGRSKPFTLREYHEARNNVLIVRNCGGLGDILIHRMMFEDFKAQHPDIRLSFACPSIYFDAVKDHPYLDEVLDWEKVNPLDYPINYNTSTACGRYEMGLAPFSDLNRSDIWARHCGVYLQNHDMHLRLTEEEVAFGKDLLARQPGYKGQPTVAVCPISAMIGKNLSLNQMGGVLDGLRRMGTYPFALHRHVIPDVLDLRYPMVSGLDIRQWMGVLNAADYVVSVDTSSFHCAGGLGKPMVGIFSFADGKVYGRYYKKWELVQKHRDDGNWTCGPCYNWSFCPKGDKLDIAKPCITEITSEEILVAFERLIEKHPPA